MSDFRKIRSRAVIEFFTLENVQPHQIRNRIIVEDTPSYATVKRWSAEFRRGRTNLEDEPGSRRPSEHVFEETCRVVVNTVLQNH